MKILFWSAGRLNIGVAYLISILKNKGHDVELAFDDRPGNQIFFDIFSNNRRVLSKLKRSFYSFSPDLVCISSNISTYSYSREFVNSIPEMSEIPVIMGGPHPTSCPEFVLDDIENVDFVCVGEGEKALAEFVEKMDSSGMVESIPGIYWKEDGELKGQGVGEMVKDVDNLPFPSWEEFTKEGVLNNELPIITGRGCPFECSYCMNSYYIDIYDKEFVRRREPENIIKEIEHFVEKYDIRKVDFLDETFTYNKEWLNEFLEIYRNRVDLPFTFQTRPDCIDDEIVDDLVESGCSSTFIGLNSADPETRRNILNRRIDDGKIRNAFELFQGKDVHVTTSAMFGIPGQSNEDMINNLDLMAKFNPDSVTPTNLYPFPKTRMTEYMLEKNILSDADLEEIKKGGKSLQSKRNFRKDHTPFVFVHIAPFYNKFKSLRPFFRKILRSNNEKIKAFTNFSCLLITFFKEIKSGLKGSR